VYTYRKKNLNAKAGEDNKYELINKEKYEELKGRRANDVPVLKKRKYFLHGRGSY